MSFRSLIAFIASVFILNSASAQDKTKFAKSGKAYATLMSASMQRTSGGARGSQPVTTYTFLLKWKCTEPLETVFWKSDKAWMNCLITVYKTSKCRKSDEVPVDKLKRNYYVKLTAMPGGKFPMPDEIQNTKGQNIFFQTPKSGWRYLPVTKITKKKDIAMP